MSNYTATFSWINVKEIHLNRPFDECAAQLPKLYLTIRKFLSGKTKNNSILRIWTPDHDSASRICSTIVGHFMTEPIVRSASRYGDIWLNEVAGIMVNSNSIDIVPEHVEYIQPLIETVEKIVEVESKRKRASVFDYDTVIKDFIDSGDDMKRIVMSNTGVPKASIFRKRADVLGLPISAFRHGQYTILTREDDSNDS